MGESGLIATPAAVACAVADALAPVGARVDRLPLTPALVWSMISESPPHHPPPNGVTTR
jgi:carbon-monoxide dehydrogenase large subunit